MDTREIEDLALRDETTALRLIETLLALRGLSRKDLDRRIGRTPGYVSQILNCTVGLKFSMLLTLIRALEFEPEVFFRTLFKRGRPLVFGADAESMAEVLARLREMDIEAPPPKPQPAREAVDLDALEALVQRAVADALAKRKGDGEEPAAKKPAKG
jgi:hypothetical protein